MKALFGIIVIIIVAALAWVAWGTISNPAAQPMPQATSTPVSITPIEHATMVLGWGDEVIYNDPTDAVALAGQPAPTIVLVTDIHGDHFSTSTLQTVVGSSTALVVPQAVADQLPDDLKSRAQVLANGEGATINGLMITAVPAYNLPEAENAERHTPGRGNGYLIEHDDTRVYIAGDTAGTPEMKALRDIDVAFVPMNMPYTMTVEEAADAVLAFKPKTVYPYHYRTPEGLSDVERFKQLVNQGDPNIDVILADWYPGQ